MTLISKVGGASGPLFGTFFLQAARPANGKSELTLDELCECFDNGLSGIVNLGKAVLGDKTMVDALTPALAALYPKHDDSLETALERAASVAREAAEATIPLIARKGRASYLGDRSVGHKDPGAASSALLLERSSTRSSLRPERLLSSYHGWSCACLPQSRLAEAVRELVLSMSGPKLPIAIAAGTGKDRGRIRHRRNRDSREHQRGDERRGRAYLAGYRKRHFELGNRARIPRRIATR